MKTYFAILGLLACTSLRSISQENWDYASTRHWVEERVGGTNQTPEANRIYVANPGGEYAAIVQYHESITIRAIVDETRLKNATLLVLVERSNGKVVQVEHEFTPVSNPVFEPKKGDVIWLLEIPTIPIFDSPPNQLPKHASDARGSSALAVNVPDRWLLAS